MDTKEIQLTNSNELFVVDQEDYERVLNFGNWCLSGKGQILSTKWLDGKTLTITRFLMGNPPSGYEWDHKDRNILNNSQSNLRLATRSQQNANRGGGWGNTSAYKGVYRDGGRWKASIQKDGKTVYLGRFDTEEEAALTFDGVSRELHGDFAVLNFPNVR